MEFVKGVEMPEVHPWVNACLRNTLVNRCGPKGIYCWSRSTLELVQTPSAQGDTDRMNQTQQGTLHLPRCREERQETPPGGTGGMTRNAPARGDRPSATIEWHTPFHSTELQKIVLEREDRVRRVGNLIRQGFPSIANLRAENDSTTQDYGPNRVSTNIRKWHKWPGNTGKRKSLVHIHPQNIRLAKLHLRFVKEILRPKLTPDLDSTWSDLGHQLNHLQDLTELALPPNEWSFKDLWGKNPGHELKGTEQPRSWRHGPRLQIKPKEAGAEAFLKTAPTHPEDNLKLSSCLNNQGLGERPQGHPQDAPTNPTLGDGTEKPPPTTTLPRTRGRVNRSANPTRTVKEHNGAFSNTLEERITAWMKTQGRGVVTGGRREESPFLGIAGNLQRTWSERKGGDDAWKLLKSEVSQSQVTTSKGVDGVLQWKDMGEVQLYDQEVTLELTAPLSTLVDTMDDLTYHLDTQTAMKEEKVEEGKRKPTGNSWYWGTLQSLRGHTDLGAGDAANFQKALEEFRLHEQGSTDHALELNGKVALHCQRRTRATLQQQRFINHDGTPTTSTTLPTTTGTPTNKLRLSVTAIASAVAGAAGFVFGLITNRPHVGAEVEGLHGAVFNLHKRTAAMMRAEAIMKTKIFMVDQGLAAMRRVGLSNAGALAVCETGRTVRKTFHQLQQGRTPASLFEDTTEMKEALTEVEGELLEPHQLELLIDKENHPDQLLSWPAAGYIMISPRATNQTEGKQDVIQHSGTLGYGWDHAGNERNTASKIEWNGLSDLQRHDILDNAFKTEATHKVHQAGKRADYLYSIWDIKVNVQIPTIERGSRDTFHLYRAKELLVEIEGQAMIFHSTEIIAHNAQTDEVGTIPRERLKRCRAWKPRTWACPRETVSMEGTCGTELWQGRFQKQCLRHFRAWPRYVPYFAGQPGSLKYTAYIPPNATLKIKCGTEDVWNRRDDTGVVTLSTQPLCKCKVGQAIISVLPTLKKNLKPPAVGAEMRLSEALKEAPFLNNTSWTAIGKELELHTGQAWSLLEAYQDVEKERKRGLLGKIKAEFQGIFVYLVFLLLGTCTAMGFFLSIKATKLCLKPYLQRRRERKRQKGQEEELERLGEIDRRINKSRGGSVLTLSQEGIPSVGDRRPAGVSDRDRDSPNGHQNASTLDEYIARWDQKNTSLPIPQTKRDLTEPSYQSSSIAGRFIGSGPFNMTQ